MSRLDRFERWLDDHTLVVVDILIAALLILLALLIVACAVDSGHDDRTAWSDFADQMNKNTDYYLEQNTGGSCGYFKTIGSEYSSTLNVSWSSYSTSYVRVYAKEGGLALEWHEITPSKGDKITSTTYIPYESICYVQANKVV